MDLLIAAQGVTGDAVLAEGPHAERGNHARIDTAGNADDSAFALQAVKHDVADTGFDLGRCPGGIKLEDFCRKLLGGLHY